MEGRAQLLQPSGLRGVLEAHARPDHASCWNCSWCLPSFAQTVVSGREALCVLLYRLAFPCRWEDMRLVFGRSESCVCETFNWMLHFTDFKWGFLLSLDVERLVPKLRTFAGAIYNKDCPLTHCWASIDGTVRGIARPIRNQRFSAMGTRGNTLSSSKES
ncbi:unnamed protein product [Ectocarpus sp. 4 AP-2014]